ncbi:unnamed protein product [Somion occarium]|uniref:Cytochrome c oxidase-assembly factor COX23, mitochondrial n=1 Tax=Somion occarium TaxID=3059160 RepID=A0ABP1E5J4_9APHY
MAVKSTTNKVEEPLPHPNDNVNPQDWQEAFNKDRTSSNPCKGASKASMSCLDRNDYNRDACLEYFQAYRDCKKAWIEQRKADRRAGRAP